MSGAAVAAAGIGAAASLGAAAMNSGGGSSGSTQSQNTLPDWLMPYAKAYMAKQLALSNKPYQAYGGFFQNLAAPGAAHAAQAQFAGQNSFNTPEQSGLFAGQGGAGGQGGASGASGAFNPAFVSKAGQPDAGRFGANGGGVSVPPGLSADEYNRYLQAIQADPSFQPQTMNAKDLAAWNKANAGLAPYMKQKPFKVSDADWQQSVLQKMQKSGPTMADIYDANTVLKNLANLR